MRFDLVNTFPHTLFNTLKMKKKDIYTLALLILLTILTAFFSTNFGSFKYLVFTVLGLSALKFFLVAFNFMEMKKANSFWKFLIIAFLVVYVGIVSIIL